MREYRASAMGYSLCQLVCGHLGYSPLPTPDFLQEKFDEGKRLEPLVVEKLRATPDCQIAYQNVGAEDGKDGEEVRLEIIPNIAVIVGHIDGRIKVTSNGGEKVLEVKTMNARLWERFCNTGWDTNDKLIEKYRWQASVYMLATGLPLMMVAWNKDTEELARHTITEPFYGVSDLARKIYAAEGYINRGEIPEECSDFPCPYVFLHPPKEEVEKADKELDGLMAAWLQTHTKKKYYEGECEKIKAAIKEYVGDVGAGKVKGSQGVTVTTTWQEGSSYTVNRKPAWVTSVSAPRKRETKDE